MMIIVSTKNQNLIEQFAPEGEPYVPFDSKGIIHHVLNVQVTACPLEDFRLLSSLLFLLLSKFLTSLLPGCHNNNDGTDDKGKESSNPSGEVKTICDCTQSLNFAFKFVCSHN